MSFLRTISLLMFLCAAAVLARSADNFTANHQHGVDQNPAGIHFSISLQDKSQFRIGERITVNYEFKAANSAQYLTGATVIDQSGRSTLERFVVDRQEDATELLAGFFELYSGLYCSYIEYYHDPRDIPRPDSPAHDSVLLTQYVRFNKPGHYRIYAVTRQVIRSGIRREYTGYKDFRPSVDDSSLGRRYVDYGGPPVTSENILELDIVPQDNAAAHKEIEAIIARTKAAYQSKLSTDDAVRLMEIGTPEARQAAADLYHSHPDNYDSTEVDYAGLAAVLSAPTRAEAVKLLQARLVNPSIAPDHGLFLALPLLQLLEKNPELSIDNLHSGGLANGNRWRNLLLANLMAEYEAIKSTLDKRSAANRAVAIRFLDLNLDPDVHKACSLRLPITAEQTAQLQAMHLAAVTDLPEEQRTRDLLGLAWTKAIPREQLLPLLEKLFASPSNSDIARIGILTKVGDFDPKLAGKMFRQRVIEQGWAPFLSNFIPESWWGDFGAPELDAYFARTFNTRHTEEMERMAPLLGRFGSAAILPEIKQAYEVEGEKWPCSMQAGMLTYFLRLDPAYGTQKTATALNYSYAHPDPRCHKSLLEVMALLRNAPELKPFAEAAVDDLRPQVSAGAIHVLALDYKNMPYERFVARLHKLHEEWSDFNEHAKDAAYTSRWNSGYAELQEIIVRLLTNNPIPRLAPLWKQAVEDCVTDDCRARLSARARDVPAR